MFSCGWLWLYSGAALMLLELLSPGFVLFFFGLSAASVGLLRLWIGEGFDGVWQFVAFSGLSIVYLVFLRRWLKNIFTGDVGDASSGYGDEWTGRAGRVVSAIEPPGTGRVLVGDAEWTAESAAAIPEGTAVRIVARRNLTMLVEPVV